MQAIVKLTRRGFRTNIKVGEIIEYNDERYILTHIIAIEHVYSSSAHMVVKGIAQLVGSKSNYSLYENTSVFTKKYPKAQYGHENPLYRVGDIFLFDGTCAEITSIDSIKYEFVDLVVTYRSRLIRPWSDEEINQAIKEDRLSKFTVIN